MPWLKLIPWNFVLIVAVLGALVMALTNYGEHKYTQGRTAAMAEVRSHELELEQRRRSFEIHQQERVNAIALNFEQERQAGGAAVRDAVAAGDRLRQQLRAALSAAGAALDAPTPGSLDDAAKTSGELLELCWSGATASAAEAEGLASQVRGLQDFAAQVSSAPTP